MIPNAACACRSGPAGGIIRRSFSLPLSLAALKAWAPAFSAPLASNALCLPAPTTSTRPAATPTGARMLTICPIWPLKRLAPAARFSAPESCLSSASAAGEYSPSSNASTASAVVSAGLASASTNSIFMEGSGWEGRPLA